jgi:hypothetical protein
MSYCPVWQTTPVHGQHPLIGAIPGDWMGTEVPDGTRGDWYDAPVGARYLYKPDETTQPIVYMKMANTGTTADWWITAPAGGGQGAALLWKKLPITTKTSAEIDTGFDLPTKAIVEKVILDVKTAEVTGGTKTLKIGLLSSESGGNAAGFVNGISTATVGLVTGSFTYVHGTNQNYISATNWGTFLYNGQLGVDTAGPNNGTINPKSHIASSVVAKSVSYQLASAHTELVADIYLGYYLLGL